MFTEYDMEKHMKVVRKDGYDEGFDDGHNSGFNDGIAQIIINMSKKGKTPDEISNLTDTDINLVNNILEQSK